MSSIIACKMRSLALIAWLAGTHAFDLCGGSCSDNMVFQRDEPATIWSVDADAPKGTEVVVLMGTDKIGSGAVGDDGGFSIQMSAQKATMNTTVTIQVGATASQTLQNVAFGDLVLCSGQSNKNAETVDIPDADNYPMIRLLQIYRSFNRTAQRRIPTQTKPWAEVSHKTVPIFSAVCYFTARETYKALAAAGKAVALGLVEADWGGTRVEAWTRPDGISKCTTRVARNLDICGVSNGTENECHALFNGMVSPILPMRFKFALWYQGEANSGSAVNYACRFPAYIHDMRDAFATPALPYFYVEMDGCTSYGAHDGGLDGKFPTQRQAQRAATLLENVDFAVAVDLGGHQGNVHSPRKQEVGRRLSLKVLTTVYGLGSAVKPSATGPVLKSIGPVSLVVSLVGATQANGSSSSSGGGSTTGGSSDSSLAVTLVFEPATATSLHSHGTADCAILNGSSKACCDQSPFQIGTVDGSWVRAAVAEIQGNSIKLTAPIASAEHATDVRYAWNGYPQCAIYDGVGGPDNHTGVAAAPFRWALPRASGSGVCPTNSTACTGSPEGRTQCCTSAPTALYPKGEVCTKNAGCLNGAQVV